MKKAKESLGQRIRAIREAKGLELEDLALEIGYPADLLRQVEANKRVPPVSLVLQLSQTFKVDMEQVPEKEAKKASRQRARSHKKRVESYAYVPLTRPGLDKHLRAYLITIDPETEHKGVEFHHQGEEFVYVLKGALSIQVGQNVTSLEAGGNIHFNSALHHKLSNPGEEAAELLVVVYVP